jgi:predicted dehydrogenase
MAKGRYTVGIIGLGYGRAHIAGFQAAGCEVTAVCQRDVATARQLADRYGVPGAFDRWEALLETARPDIVVIATPPALHRAIAEQALAAGAHVLCEKPLAMDGAEGRAMVEAAARAGRVAMTGFNWRFPAAMQRFHAMAAEGAAGRPLHVSGRWFAPRWADEGVAPTWRMDRAVAGQGAMGDMGVHLVDLVRWNFGEFARVCAHAGIAYPSRTVPGGERAQDTEDFCTILGELASGVQVTLEASRAARGVNEHALAVFGQRGALGYRLVREGKQWYRGELRAAAGDGPLQPVKVPTGLPRSAAVGDALEVLGKATVMPLVRRMLAAIRKGETASPSLEDGYRAQLVLDAVGASLARKAWVDVAAPPPIPPREPRGEGAPPSGQESTASS